MCSWWTVIIPSHGSGTWARKKTVMSSWMAALLSSGTAIFPGSIWWCFLLTSLYPSTSVISAKHRSHEWPFLTHHPWNIYFYLKTDLSCLGSTLAYLFYRASWGIGLSSLNHMLIWIYFLQEFVLYVTWFLHPLDLGWGKSTDYYKNSQYWVQLCLNWVINKGSIQVLWYLKGILTVNEGRKGKRNTILIFKNLSFPQSTWFIT